MRYLLLSALIAFASSALAADFRASKGLSVRQINDNLYEVYGVPRVGPSDYWCTIGLYAQQILRADQNSRIYVVGNYQKGQRTYRFSMSPVGTASEAEPVRSVSIKVDGANRRVNAARAECYSRGNSR